jgi:DNA ligase-1
MVIVSSPLVDRWIEGTAAAPERHRCAVPIFGPARTYLSGAWVQTASNPHGQRDYGVWVTLLADLVDASTRVAETGARSQKVAILAELLASLEPDEVAIATGFLAGVPRQGRVGVGYATVYGVECEPAGEPSLTLADLDAAITEMQGSIGSGSVVRRREVLLEVLARATAHEAAFVRRLLTGELRQGALAGVMADAVAKAAAVPADLVRRALMLSGDLTHTAELALSAGAEGLRGVGFQLFRPVLPMLASTAEDVAAALAGVERASVEWKLDGIRIQIHRRGDELRIYTRNLNEITESLPGIAEAVRALPVEQAVLDGEALWMGDDDPAAFQETVAQLDADGVRAFLFDLLHADGDDLLDTPLEQRAARLRAIAPGLEVPRVLTADAGEAQRVLDEALAAGHEGVVVKDAASLYAAGRRGKAWRKVKPVRTYDLVVLGAEWGHGRRQGRLSNLHLGARDPGGGGYVMVGKTFKGMTDELLEWQTGELLAREVERRGIAVLVRPELVVEIALDGVQASRRYPGGVALRFARVKRYRPDKSAAEADTIDDLRALLHAGLADRAP